MLQWKYTNPILFFLYLYIPEKKPSRLDFPLHKILCVYFTARSPRATPPSSHPQSITHTHTPPRVFVCVCVLYVFMNVTQNPIFRSAVRKSLVIIMFFFYFFFILCCAVVVAHLYLLQQRSNGVGENQPKAATRAFGECMQCAICVCVCAGRNACVHLPLYSAWMRYVFSRESSDMRLCLTCLCADAFIFAPAIHILV